MNNTFFAGLWDATYFRGMLRQERRNKRGSVRDTLRFKLARPVDFQVLLS